MQAQSDSLAYIGSPHRSPSVCCIVVLRLSVDYPCRRLLMVSTNQAEAANGPTRATESPVAQRELTQLAQASSFHFISHFVSVIPVFTTTPRKPIQSHQTFPSPCSAPTFAPPLCTALSISYGGRSGLRDYSHTLPVVLSIRLSWFSLCSTHRLSEAL